MFKHGEISHVGLMCKVLKYFEAVAARPFDIWAFKLNSSSSLLPTANMNFSQAVESSVSAIE